MNEAATHTTAHPRPARPTMGAYLWFAGMVGLWTAFGVVALVSVDKLGDLWAWVTGLPLVAEIVVWIAALPWVLGLWVSQTAWPEWLRILLVLSFAVGWTVVSIPWPRGSKPAGRIHWEIRPGEPHDVIHQDSHGATR
jgi:hypothetical protein